MEVPPEPPPSSSSSLLNLLPAQPQPSSSRQPCHWHLHWARQCPRPLLPGWREEGGGGQGHPGVCGDNGVWGWFIYYKYGHPGESLVWVGYGHPGGGLVWVGYGHPGESLVWVGFGNPGESLVWVGFGNPGESLWFGLGMVTLARVFGWWGGSIRLFVGVYVKWSSLMK